MHVMPHNELRELEHAEHARVDYLPAGLAYERALQSVEDALHIDAVLIGRHFPLKLGHQDIEVLLELLEERDVNDCIVIDLAHDVAAHAELSHELHRHQNYRCVAVGFLLIVGPLKEAARQEKCARAVLIESVAGFPVELLKAVLELLCGQGRVDLFVFAAFYEDFAEAFCVRKVRELIFLSGDGGLLLAAFRHLFTRFHARYY